MPSLLKKMGYRTSLIGKWHLGEPPNFSPRKSGYDYFYGIYAGGADYFNHTLYENDKVVKDQGYLTDLLGDRAVEEIETSAKTGKPFFMSLHFTAPHWPWEGPDDKQANAKKPPSSGHWNGGDLETYGEMVRSLDDNAGKALDAIERRGLADNTIVVFTSDNGGERFSDTWPFVGVKTELLEGGLRVPLMVKWPGRISAGTTSGQVMTSMDFLPTLLAAAGSAPDPAYPSDGENLMDILLGDTTPRPRKLYWRYKALEQIALRDHDWKYLKIADREFLFNLAEDQRERVNLKESEPALFRQLKADFDMWNAGMLPYTLTSAEYTLSDHLADRY
jgi:arylsulfatase A-like enzyme